MLFNGNLSLEKLPGGDVRTYGRTDGRKEIHPCVLQDIGPLGPLPCSIIARAIDILVLDQLIIEQKSNCSLTLLVVLALFV